MQGWQPKRRALTMMTPPAPMPTPAAQLCLKAGRDCSQLDCVWLMMRPMPPGVSFLHVTGMRCAFELLPCPLVEVHP